ncbi:uncharacterized protein LOC141641371 [Silene latifolia]|uniref:uncharacterized protein LOC141641371 n=1 Tax=Silene latifolia TaxID=37657 RepID=UPI003D77514C
MWKRVNTRDRILKWKVMDWDDSKCIFCGECLETVCHLFLHCKFSWQLWSDTCDVWGVTWVCPLEIDDAFLVWNNSHFVGFEKRLWEAFFIAIVTIIWEVRNVAIFENKTPCWPSMMDKLLLRVGVWCKAWKENIPYTLEEWLNNWKSLRSWKEQRIMERRAPRVGA